MYGAEEPIALKQFSRAVKDFHSMSALCKFLMSDFFKAHGDVKLALSVRRLADRYCLASLQDAWLKLQESPQTIDFFPEVILSTPYART